MLKIKDLHQKLTKGVKVMKKILNRLFIIFVSVAVLSIIFNACSNIGIKKSFTQKENGYSYKQAAAQNNLDLIELKWVFQNVIGLGGNNYIQEIVSPVTISYYESVNALAPVYKIEKGTMIYFNSEEELGYELSEYRGTDSLPTHRHGWRLAKPFKVEGERGIRDNFLYVKLSDLEEVTEAWIEANPTLMQSKTKQELVEFQTLNRDHSLYQEGIYLSPDLKNPVLSNFTYMMFAIAFVVGMTNLCLSRFSTKK